MTSTANQGQSPDLLDRLVEVMRHFHCSEPRELERLLGLPEESLPPLLRSRSPVLPSAVLEGLERAGVRREFLLEGRGSMLTDRIDAERLAVMKRHAARLLGTVLEAQRRLSGPAPRRPMQVTDGSADPAATEEELINLLVEALGDHELRDRLLQLIRADTANHRRPGKRG